MQLPVLIAIDWSGAKDAASQRKHIWAAKLSGNDLSLDSRRTRDEVTAWLIEQKRLYPRLLVGLDFAFSFPLWYVEQHGPAIHDFWTYIEENAERLILCKETPFWGRAAHPKPRRLSREESLRQTDLHTIVNGQYPKSAFQVNYPGAVGTATLRGAKHLLELQRAGFSIWPFQHPGKQSIVEIYPRLFTQIPVSRLDERRKFLDADRFRWLPKEVSRDAIQSVDAFDALVSVLGMRDRCEEFLKTAGNLSHANRLEGKIFAQPEPLTALL
ncbi:hypothetical protein [Silvibacterium acidisoli]|uniref:hypothetical protein n=1 Tax=Acidobacteriaceae bacterium ZG23-2 TaxID=2883246 RepID=UPI00406CD712